MSYVSVENRTSLLSDNGAGYVSRAFGDYLKLVGIKHILAALSHHKTNGKIERYHQTLKCELNQVPFEITSKLREAIENLVEYYNYRRYHEGLGNVTPYDVYTGKYLEIIETRKGVKSKERL